MVEQLRNENYAPLHGGMLVVGYASLEELVRGIAPWSTVYCQHLSTRDGSGQGPIYRFFNVYVAYIDQVANVVRVWRFYAGNEPEVFENHVADLAANAHFVYTNVRDWLRHRDLAVVNAMVAMDMKHVGHGSVGFIGWDQNAKRWYRKESSDVAEGE